MENNVVLSNCSFDNLELEKVIMRTSTGGEGISLSEWSCTAHQHLLECNRYKRKIVHSFIAIRLTKRYDARYLEMFFIIIFFNLIFYFCQWKKSPPRSPTLQNGGLSVMLMSVERLVGRSKSCLAKTRRIINPVQWINRCLCPLLRCCK